MWNSYGKTDSNGFQDTKPLDNIIAQTDVEYSKSNSKGRKTEADLTKKLSGAYSKLHDLESRLKNLEKHIPKNYPDVKFLNYKDRKRILVSICKLIHLWKQCLMYICFSFHMCSFLLYHELELCN